MLCWPTALPAGPLTSEALWVISMTVKGGTTVDELAGAFWWPQLCPWYRSSDRLGLLGSGDKELSPAQSSMRIWNVSSSMHAGISTAMAGTAAAHTGKKRASLPLRLLIFGVLAKADEGQSCVFICWVTCSGTWELCWPSWARTARPTSWIGGHAW